MSLEHEWKDAKKKLFSARSESRRARRKTTDPILPTVWVERTQTEAGYTRTNTRGVAKPNAAQSLPKPAPRKTARRSGAYKRKENPPDARKSRTKDPFATQRPDTQSPVVDRQWIPKDTAFGTQESNSPFEDRPVVPLTRSAFSNPSAEVQEPPASEPGTVAVRRPNTRLLVFGRFSISEFGKTQPAIPRPRKKQVTSKTKSPSCPSIMLTHTAYREPRGHKPTNTPGINLESSAS